VRRTLLFLLPGLIALFVAACQPAAPAAQPKSEAVVPTTVPATKATDAPKAAAPAADGKTLRFAVLPITDVLPVYVAEQKGYFKDAGLNVQLIPVASAAERDQVVQSGQADGVLTDLINIVLFNAEQPRLQVVRKARQAFPNAPQFRLLAGKDSGIANVQGLKGVDIGISDNSVIAYWTDRVLEKEGLAKADIKTQAVPNIVQRAQLLGQGQLKAGVLPDPLASLAMLQGAKVIADDTKYPELGQSVLAFRTPYVQSNAEDIRKFTQAWDKAVADLRANPAEFRALLVEKGRVPEQIKDTLPIPLFPDPAVTSEAELKDVSDWAVQKGILKAPVNYGQSVNPGFVK